ncbi:MAG TPA: DinB family protein [Steroidobacteraceae bacterium]
MKTLLDFQLTGSFDLLEKATSGMTGEEWGSRAHASANLLGFTVWHSMRTIDWAVNGVAACTGELADLPKWSFVKPSGAMFGAGLSMEEADATALAVGHARMLSYADCLRQQVLSWFRSLPAEDLDRIIDLRAAGLATRDHLQPAAWHEVEDLDRIPLWKFLARPAVSHIRVHYGEVMAQLQCVRAQTMARGTR